ncbi:sugar transferase [Rhizobium sp. BK251]|uniref:sugar transferase n=1 Tax=Rhizobium sp. BK251 TaxID=2512125 RepID=UPI0010DCE324|nr:sugar transferase [Rhizobium sp. BK251]TCL74465.1 lipopolysaccharide/colanic/teichoic acid biosynthesis glycosyltransferase [Rhizobium sp. BK251]
MSITDLHHSITRGAFNVGPKGLFGGRINTHLFVGHGNGRKALQLFAKRMLDIVIASSALVVLLPFLLAVAIMIRVDSRGPVLFYQTRWGKNCRKIRVYKFRSMYTNLGDRSGVAQTVRNDPRITRVGRILRRTNIDELPQLLNVLKGDMSLVGPRCHALGMRAGGTLYEDLVPQYHRRHMMKPGMTGLAQMRGLRGPTDKAAKAKARIKSDLHYIENFSVLLDIKIIVGTVICELRGGRGF